MGFKNIKGCLMDTEITYHHPWLGRIYYRGFPIAYFIEEKVSFLETAYFLITGRYLSHRKIIEEMNVDSSIPYNMKRLIDNIFIKFSLDENLNETIYNEKINFTETIQNLFIIHLDLHIGRDTVYVINRKRESNEKIGIILNSYKYYKQHVSNTLLKPYRQFKENQATLEKVMSYCSKTSLVYLEILRKLVLHTIKEEDKRILDEIKRLRKECYRLSRKYLNVDIYTPLIIEGLGYLDKIAQFLFIPRSLGLLAYAYEETISSSKEDIESIVYKGPINLPKKKFLEKFSY